MGKGGWAVVGLAAAFLVVQSCGEDFGTGRIMTPGAAPAGPEGGEPAPPVLPAVDRREYWNGEPPRLVEDWSWQGGAVAFRGEPGARLSMRCVPERVELVVWGANPYTDDSPVCVAAVHAGVIDAREGGTVTIELRPGRRSFAGATRHGVTGLSWGPYPGSYLVLR